MARPTKYNKETAEHLIDFISSGLTVRDSCNGCNISEDTFSRWRKKYPDFNRAVAQASDLQWKTADSLAKYGCRRYKRNQSLLIAKKYQPLLPNKLPSLKVAADRKFMGLPIRYNVPENLSENKPYFNASNNHVEWIDGDGIFHACSQKLYRQRILRTQDEPYFWVF